MKNNLIDANRWLLQGIQDLDDAIFNLSGKRYNIACFLAQQSAEKVLKAYLLAQEVDHVWGQAISDLCKDAITFDSNFESIESSANSLDKYYIPTRYPDALPGSIPSKAFDEDDANKAISLAEKIVSFVKIKLEEIMTE